MSTERDPRRDLPSVDAALGLPGVDELLRTHPRQVVVDALRIAIASRREAGGTTDGLAEEVALAVRPSLRRVLNATGVVVHTNLGRAPLAKVPLRQFWPQPGIAISNGIPRADRVEVATITSLSISAH